jgi:hypothetical protein
MSARVPALGALLVWSAAALAADPPAVDTLPPPRELPPAAVTVYPVVPPPTGYWRTSSYAVWQNYGVSSNGQWVPRVAYTPDGAFYMSNGQPYYWATAHPRWWQPSVSGTPYRSVP